jgi:hypothetical protein
MLVIKCTASNEALSYGARNWLCMLYMENWKQCEVDADFNCVLVEAWHATVIILIEAGGFHLDTIA